MDKLDELRKRTMNLNDGIYCYYKNEDFYINPITTDSIDVYYNKKTYNFNSYEEMIIYPFLDDEQSIADCIKDITW